MNFPEPEFTLSANSGSSKERCTLLVIDDSHQLCQYLRSSLLDTYVIEETDNNNDGLALAKQILPDLIVTQLAMPELDGESLCFQLKRCELTSHIPIIILSYQNDHYSRIKSFYLGADDYMMMPLQPVELQVRIENLIQSRKTLQRKFSRHVELKPAAVEVQSEDQLFLQRIMQVMESNMNNPLFGSDQFAKQLGLSQTRLYRKLVALTGYSSNDFIRRMRLQRAADLLEKRVGNVSDVAYQVGFNSLSYFAKCFKEFYQSSPRDYVKRAAV